MIYIILFISLIFRLINLNQSFWLDEAISALTAKASFPYQWYGIAGDFQPPLYYLILHLFMKLNIWNEWFLRIPSVLFGVFTVYIIYLIANKLFNKKTALISSLLLAISQFHIYYSQELRMYSLLALLTTLSMWFYIKKQWIRYIFAGIIGAYSSYMYFFIFFPQMLWILLFRNRKNMYPWIMSMVIILLSYLPWLPNLLKQLETSRMILSNLPQWRDLSTLPLWKLFPQIFIKFTFGRISFDNKFLYGLIFLILVLIFGYILTSIKKDLDKKLFFVINWFLIPLIIICIVNLFVPIANVWRLIFLLPPFLIIISRLIDLHKYSFLFLTLAVLISLTANFFYFLNEKYQRENWRGLVSELDTNNDPVIFTVENGFAPYTWYSKKKKVICGPLTLDKCTKSNNFYYISYLKDIFDKNNIVQKNLSSRYLLMDIRNYQGVGFVYHYENSY